ncbi:hypothetical protein INT44_002986 [Umbelopsis vinacea]|uniref:CDT1 Geminin-binding domain-containing protein n=1 Tax=Umbelopsis vinacea TaxID=44442 RepID=A0A8H7Q741_9FUNG|nr:hypothetical protein INT44_002986 [Umbelopsis vinacea]
MAKGESTLSTRYRLRKKPETGGSLKSDLQSPKIDQKQQFKSTPERITQTVVKKKNDIKNNRKTASANDLRTASLPQQNEKPAIAAMDKYVIRRKEEVTTISQKVAEEKHAVLPPTTVVNASADILSKATSIGVIGGQLIAEESTNLKHALANDEERDDVDNDHPSKFRKVSLETTVVQEDEDAQENTQEPLTPTSQTSDQEPSYAPSNSKSSPTIPKQKLPISPARTPTKTIKSTNLILNAPASPVRFRKPQAENESDPGLTNLMYRMRQDRSGLKLPDKYEALERIQYALDHTILFATAQNSICHFHKIRKPVENMSRRTFDLNHLAQIKHLEPNAYNMRPVRVLHEGQRIESLLIGFPEDDEQPKEQSRLAHPLKSNKIATSAQIEDRKLSFHNKLLDLVSASHDSFLKSLKPDAVNDETRKLKNWHPLFKLDSVPDIPEAELPTLRTKIVDTAEYVRTGTLKSKISDTLAKLDKKLGPKKQETSATIAISSSVTVAAPQQASGETGPNDTIKSRTSSLLERIRAKQQKKQEDEMYEPSPETIQRNILLSRLPDMVDSIYYMYTSAKRNVMFVREVSRKLSESYKVPLSESEAEAHITLLAEVAPKWCSIAVADTGSILRVDRTQPLKEVKATLLQK